MKRYYHLLFVIVILFGCNNDVSNPDKNNVGSMNNQRLIDGKKDDEPDKKNTMRYFMFTYQCDSQTNYSFGNYFFSTDGGMPKKSFIKEQIRRENRIKFAFNEIVITNIHEFNSEEDYNNFSQ